MDKIWYYQKKHGVRFLKVEEIARLCDCGIETIDHWFGDDVVIASSERYVDSAKVVGFLVSNDMPVDALLYPPNTRKLLVISIDNHSFQYEERVNCVLNFFSGHSNLLIEKSSPGQLTDLSIVSSPPDIVVYFMGPDESQSCKTLLLITSFPELFSLIVLRDRELASRELRKALSGARLVVDDYVSTPEFYRLLAAAFTGGGDHA